MDSRDRIVAAIGEQTIAGRRRAYDQVEGLELSDDELELLLPVFHDDDPLIRRHAVTLLGKLSVDAASFELLKKALRDGNWVVREAAIEAIAALDEPWLSEWMAILIDTSLYDRKPLLRENARRGIQRRVTHESGEAVVRAYISACDDRRFTVRCRAIKGLATFCEYSADATAKLKECGNDSHVKVRKAVVAATTSMGRSVLPLIPMLCKRRFDVCEATRGEVVNCLSAIYKHGRRLQRKSLQIVIDREDPGQCLDQLLVTCCGDFESDLKQLCARRLTWSNQIGPNFAEARSVEDTALTQLVALAIANHTNASSEPTVARMRKQQTWFIEQVMTRIWDRAQREMARLT